MNLFPGNSMEHLTLCIEPALSPTSAGRLSDAAFDSLPLRISGRCRLALPVPRMSEAGL